MMKEKNLYAAVGLLVTLGFAALLFLALQVSGTGSKREASYVVTADFTNIGSLKAQSRVALGGVTVGRVVSIELDKHNFLAKVKIEIFSRYDQIPDDSRLSIVTAGLLGDNYLTITPGFAQECLHYGSHLDAGQTVSAVILEELISKFLTSTRN